MAFRIKKSDREILWLTGGLWLVAYVLFLAPAMLRPEGLPGWKAVLIGLAVFLALLISPGVYAALKLTEGRTYRVRLAVAGAAVLTAAVTVSVLHAGMYEWAYPRFAPEKETAGLVRWSISHLLVFTPLYGFYAAVLALLGSRAKMEEHERQLAEARAAAQQAQIAALRFQLNPHFLFNTLNAISSLIVTSRNPEAELMMQRLCEFLRASLASDPNGFTTLEDELATVEAYLEIEQARFGDRLQVAVDCPAELLDALAPSFILQPLVENAVKYAVAPSRETVTIRVEASRDGDDLVLMVEDDGAATERVDTRSGTGVGLQNVRRRLDALYGPRGVLEAAPRQRGFLAVVRMPLTRSIGRRRSAAA